MANQIKVGDTVYQGANSDSIREMTVERVGRKFFYTDGGRKYDKNTMELVRDFGNKPQCYTSRQELEDTFEIAELMESMRKKFGGYGLKPYSLDKLQLVMAILEG